MKITKEEYQKFVKMYDSLVDEIDVIAKLKGIDYDEIISITDQNIVLSEEVHTGCGDYETEHRYIKLEELMMDYDELSDEYDRQKEEAEKAAIEQYQLNQARLKKEQEARDIKKYNELKIKLNK